MIKRFIILILACQLTSIIASQCWVQIFCQNAGSDVNCAPSSLNVARFKGNSYSLENFNVISFSDLNTTNGAFGGKVATATNLNTNNITVGIHTPNSDTGVSLIVGNNFADSTSLANIIPASSKVIIGGSNTVPSLDSRNLGPGSVDFSAALNYWTNISQEMYVWSIGRTIDGYDTPWTIKITNTKDPVLNINCNRTDAVQSISIGVTYFTFVSQLNFDDSCPQDSLYVINVVGYQDDGITQGGQTLLNTKQTTRNVIFNFPQGNEVDVIFHDNGLIINPLGPCNFGAFDGQVICNGFSGQPNPKAPGALKWAFLQDYQPCDAPSGSASSSSSSTSTSSKFLTSGTSSSSTSGKTSTGPKTSTSTTGSKTSASTSGTLTSTSGASSSCVSGHMKCLTSETFSTCDHNSWGPSQSCSQGLSCTPSRDYIYCQ